MLLSPAFGSVHAESRLAACARVGPRGRAGAIGSEIATTEIDLLDPTFYGPRARAVYRELRPVAPIVRDERNGIWGVTTWQGVRAVGGNPAVFSSAAGTRVESGPVPWMMDMDPPDHTKHRKLVNRGFTPARVRDHEARIRWLTDRLIDGFCERGECDFRRDLAAPLPLVVICDMLGIPPVDHGQVLDLSDRLLGSLQGSADDVATAVEAFGEWSAYARSLIGERREHPADDLVSVLVHAEVDGDRLTDDELVFEILLLLLGGDETTRNVGCGGLEALLLHPEQWARLCGDREALPAAVEELLRWVTPIQYMARTVVADTELAGRPLPAGETVMMLYESANFDEDQFVEPERFEIGRAPNEHVAFGFGAHHCLGASLARLELRVLFERVTRRMPDVSIVGPAPSRTIIGISSMPVRFTPTPIVA